MISISGLAIWFLTTTSEPVIVDNSTPVIVLEPASTATLSPTEEEVEESLETATPVVVTYEADIDLEALYAPFWEVWELLKVHYVDQPLDEEVMMQGALEMLEHVIMEEGIEPSDMALPENADSASDLSEEAQTPSELSDLFLAFWKKWQAIKYAPVEETINYEEFMRSSLVGMVDSLGDPYTSYMDPDTFHQLNIELEGEYEGIGAWVDPSGDYLAIISPMQDSPAERAGLQTGDLVIAIDGEDMTGIDGNLVIRRVLGPAGSKVTLTIQRDGIVDPFDVEITRAHIVIPSITGELLEGKIAYIQILTFGDDTASDLREEIKELLRQNPEGFIIDVRNNGGGYLHSAVDVTSEFLSDGIALIEEYGDGSREVHEIRPGGLATELPLVLLVNEGSASASEILAGAIQDYERGILVGAITFGKGSVQLPIALDDEQGVLRVTIARWLTPEDRHIQGQGIEPDILVEFSQEHIEAGLDPQLEKAIEIILNP
jgi:carboxyl-terminal processing protease